MAYDPYVTESQKRWLHANHPDVAMKLETQDITPWEAVDIVNARGGKPTYFASADKIKRNLYYQRVKKHPVSVVPSQAPMSFDMGKEGSLGAAYRRGAAISLGQLARHGMHMAGHGNNLLPGMGDVLNVAVNNPITQTYAGFTGGMGGVHKHINKFGLSGAMIRERPIRKFINTARVSVGMRPLPPINPFGFMKNWWVPLGVAGAVAGAGVLRKARTIPKAKVRNYMIKTYGAPVYQNVVGDQWQEYQ
jgi:hypothetical protein